MKTLNCALLALSIFASIPAAHAGSCNGGSCTGGGNVLKDFLISDYAKPASEMPHFANAERYLKALDERAPEFAAELRGFLKRDPQQADGVQWYLIPQQIRELPADVTHLHFQTDQPMYQVGKEIFVSESDTKARDPELMGRVYLQDLIEMAHPTKDPESVRKLMIYLKANNYAPPQDNLVNMLQVLGFGKFDTKREVDQKKAVVANFQSERMKAFISAAKDVCGSWEPGIALDKRNNLAALYQKAFGLSTKKFGKVQKIDSSFAPLLREHVLQVRNDLWKDEHFASFHALLDLTPVNKDLTKAYVYGAGFTGDNIATAYWYSGLNHENGTVDGSKLINTVSQESKDRIAKYEEKYKGLGYWDRSKRLCSEVDAIAKKYEGQAAAEKEESSPAKGEAGQTDAR